MRQDRRWRGKTIGAALVAALALWPLTQAQAQTESALNCSGTVGATAAAVVFANGAPQKYVFIANPSAAATLWINNVGGTAAANASGSFPLQGTGNSATLPPNSTISIIASTGSTPYTCSYK